MIISDKDALKRLDSPNNLINKLKSISTKHSSRNDAMSLFTGKGNDAPVKKFEFHPPVTKTAEIIPLKVSAEPIEPPAEVNHPRIDEILDSSESKIKLGLAHDKALDLLTKSVTALSAKLDDVKADKLPAVVVATSKAVEFIRRERNEAIKNDKTQEVHYHFYTPEQKKVSDYPVIEVSASASPG